MDEVNIDFTDEEWQEIAESIMDSMYPEGYDPDIDGSIFDDD